MRVQCAFHESFLFRGRVGWVKAGEVYIITKLGFIIAVFAYYHLVD